MHKKEKDCSINNARGKEEGTDKKNILLVKINNDHHRVFMRTYPPGIGECIGVYLSSLKIRMLKRSKADHVFTTCQIKCNIFLSN